MLVAKELSRSVIVSCTEEDAGSRDGRAIDTMGKVSMILLSLVVLHIP